MSLLEELENTIKRSEPKPTTQVDKYLASKEVQIAIQELYKKEYGYKQITKALNIHYKGKLGVTTKESRSPIDNSFDTRETSTGAKRYLYHVDNKFTEPQICKVLGIKHSLKQK